MLVRRSALVALGLVTLSILGCPGATHPETRVCDGEERPQLDCMKEIKYDTQKVSGGFQALGVSAQASTEQIALRQVGAEVERYAAAARTLCDEYNKCVVPRAQYATRSENLRRRLEKAPELLEHVQAA